MKLGTFLPPIVFSGILFASSCGPSNQQEEPPAEVTPVDEADRSRYNINEDTETILNLDSTHVDSTLINQNP